MAPAPPMLRASGAAGLRQPATRGLPVRAAGGGRGRTVPAQPNLRGSSPRLRRPATPRVLAGGAAAQPCGL
eukprot:8866988-Alexandrium_andersonii.AAC.1